MATKTGHQVQGDILSLMRGSVLAESVSGGVYRDGSRPRDSRQEDIVVSFTSGLADQIQSGVVAVNIYIPDVAPYGNGVLVEDGARAEEIEALAQGWVESLTAGRSCYLFELQQTIYTEAEPSIGQHYVVVKLRYDYFDE